jgi:hypothetical protein
MRQEWGGTDPRWMGAGRTAVPSGADGLLSRALGGLPMVSVWGDRAAVTEVTGEQWREAVVLPGDAHVDVPHYSGTPHPSASSRGIYLDTGETAGSPLIS